MNDTADTAWYLLFKDGPCAGDARAGAASSPPHDNLACGGMVYTVYRVDEGAYLALPPTAAPPHLFEPAPPAPIVVADGDVLRAWDSMWHGVARRVPQYVNRTKALRSRVRSAGARGR